MLYPPDQLPPIHYPPTLLSVSDWIEYVSPKLGERIPHQCTLGDGDLLYIPETWYHATLNLGESVGLAGQLKEPATELQKLWREGNNRMRSDPSYAVEIYQEMTQKFPQNTEAQYMLGLSLGMANEWAESIVASRRSLELSAERGEEADHASAFTNVCWALLMRNGGREDWEQAEDACRRSVEAFDRDSDAWANLADVLSKLGRDEEAEEANARGLKAQAVAEAAALGGIVDMPNQTD